MRSFLLCLASNFYQYYQSRYGRRGRVPGSADMRKTEKNVYINNSNFESLSVFEQPPPQIILLINPHGRGGGVTLQKILENYRNISKSVGEDNCRKTSSSFEGALQTLWCNFELSVVKKCWKNQRNKWVQKLAFRSFWWNIGIPKNLAIVFRKLALRFTKLFLRSPHPPNRWYRVPPPQPRNYGKYIFFLKLSKI